MQEKKTLELIAIESKICELQAITTNYITKKIYEELVVLCFEIARLFDNVLQNNESTAYVQMRIDKKGSNRKRIQSILGYFERQHSILESKLKANYPQVVNDETVCSLSKIELLKIQMDLVKQQGFYLMFKDKTKVNVQADILIVAGNMVQEISGNKILLKAILEKLNGLKAYTDYDYVTETEENIISYCFDLIQDELLSLIVKQG